MTVTRRLVIELAGSLIVAAVAWAVSEYRLYRKEHQ